MKRYIKSSLASSEPQVSGCSFDFIYSDRDYADVYADIVDVVESVCNDFGLDLIGTDADSVDYSDYTEYANKDVGQFSFSFAWTDSYPAEDLMRAMSRELGEVAGVEIIGYDFHSTTD